MMRNYILLLFFIILCLSLAEGQQAKDSVRWFEMRGTEIRGVHSKITDKDYELIINLPYSYKKETMKQYPVVYFCDGYYDFALLAMIYADQIFDKTINECFLIGFSYKGENLDYGRLRTYDYTPTKLKSYNGTGGAPNYLKVVEQEFIPYMEKNYRIDTSFRALGGSSLGGLFVLYTMFTRPSLFNAYIAISPAPFWDNDWLFRYEEEFYKQHPSLPVALYMTGAEKEFADRPEFLQGIKRFNEVLKNHEYKNFRYNFRILDDAYHASSKPEGYTRGMQFVFEPLLKK